MLGCPPPTIISSTFPLYSSIHFPLSTPFPSTPPHFPFFFLSSLFFNTCPSIYSISFYSTSRSFLLPFVSILQYLSLYLFLFLLLNLSFLSSSFRLYSSIPFPLSTPFPSTPPHLAFLLPFLSILQYLSLYLLLFILLHLTFLSSSFRLYSSIPFPLSIPFPSTPPHVPFFFLLSLFFNTFPLSIPFPSTSPHVPFFFLSSLFFNTFPSIYSFSFYSTSRSFLLPFVSILQYLSFYLLLFILLHLTFLSSSFRLYSSIPFPLSTPVHSTPPHVPFFFLSSLFFNTFPSIYYFPFYSTSPCISSVLNSFCFI